MSSFTSQANNPSLPIMTLNNGNLMLSNLNSLSFGDIAKINRKYLCRDSKYYKYDKGDNIENAIPWRNFIR